MLIISSKNMLPQVIPKTCAKKRVVEALVGPRFLIKVKNTIKAKEVHRTERISNDAAAATDDSSLGRLNIAIGKRSNPPPKSCPMEISKEEMWLQYFFIKTILIP